MTHTFIPNKKLVSIFQIKLIKSNLLVYNIYTKRRFDMSEYKVQVWRKRVKILSVELLGGKCWKCGYNKTLRALAFHHIEAESKDYSISNMLKNPQNLDNIANELNKCVLLCHNCHCE